MTIEELQAQHKKILVRVAVDGREVFGRLVGRPGQYARIEFFLNGEKQVQRFFVETVLHAVNHDTTLLA
jgi:hypothetical protein